MGVQNTITNLQNNTNMVNYANQRKNLGNSRMNREGFMQLILAELQNQDPTNPKDNSQMLQQQLMLEQADQMHGMSLSNQFSQAGTLVGKNVDLVDAKWDFANGVSMPPEWDFQSNKLKTVNGTVESVQYDYAKGVALVKVDGYYYEMSQVRQVNASAASGGNGSQTVNTPPPTNTTPPPTNNNDTEGTGA